MPEPLRVHRRVTAERWVWVDARLVPAAATVWAATLLMPWASAPALGAVAAAASVVAVLLVARARRPWAAAVALAATALAVTAALGLVRTAERQASPLTALAADGHTVTLQLELRTDPRPVAGPGPPRVLVEAVATVVTGPDGPRQLRGDRVLVFAPAEGWTGLLPGQPLTVRAGLAAPRTGDDLVALVSARGPPDRVGGAGPGALQAVAGEVRSGLVASAGRALSPAEAGLLPGLVVGDTSALDPALADDFRAAGLSHLTAVSGANVAIVLVALLAPLRRRGVDRRWQAVVGVVGIAAFTVLARPSASVVRAAGMGAVTLLALAAGRPRAAVPALGAVVVVLLLADPALARDPGFALSVAATAAIVLLAPRWSRALRRRRLAGPVADALAVSAAAGLATAPLVAGLSGQVSLVSLPANLLAAPAVAPATVLGLAAALTGPVSPELADGLAWLAGWPVRWLVVVGRSGASVPDGTAAWPAGTAGAVGLTLLLLVVAAALLRWPRLRPLGLAALVGVVALGWPVRQATRGWPVADGVVVACSVGQGDALVFPTGPGTGVLVDAGPDGSLVAGCLDRLGIASLPLVVLSHLDADHVAGLAGALAGRDVGEVTSGPLSPADERAPAVDAVVRAAGGSRTTMLPGDTRRVGTLLLEALGPEPAWATAAADANDLSLVVRATQRGLRVLLTGDLGEDSERRLRLTGADLRADVLKVPHHGSADVDPAFLGATGARVAVISVGADNTYGHPAPTLLGELARAGMRVLRTDRGGDVAVVGSSEQWGVVERGPDPRTGAAPAPAPADRRPAGPADRRPAGPADRRSAGPADRRPTGTAGRHRTGQRCCAGRSGARRCTTGPVGRA